MIVRFCGGFHSTGGLVRFSKGDGVDTYGFSGHLTPTGLSLGCFDCILTPKRAYLPCTYTKPRLWPTHPDFPRVAYMVRRGPRARLFLILRQPRPRGLSWLSPRLHRVARLPPRLLHPPQKGGFRSGLSPVPLVPDRVRRLVARVVREYGFT